MDTGAVVAPITGGAVPAPPWVRKLKPANLVPLQSTDFFGVTRPPLKRHDTLFGAHFLTPLAHINNGSDANGVPDVPEEGESSLPDVERILDADHSDDVSAAHEHTRFMGDLRLPKTEAAGESGQAALDTRVRIVGGKRGDSCTAACAAAGAGACVLNQLPAINDCATLQRTFACIRCEYSQGSDQPALVDTAAPADKLPGACLINTAPQSFDCEGSWIFAQRLCPCESETT